MLIIIRKLLSCLNPHKLDLRVWQSLNTLLTLSTDDDYDRELRRVKISLGQHFITFPIGLTANPNIVGAVTEKALDITRVSTLGTESRSDLDD